MRDVKTYSILTVTLEVEPSAATRINQRLAKDLLHIAREALTNVRKHAHATQVHIQVTRTSAGVKLTIVDNGVGIDLDREPDDPVAATLPNAPHRSVTTSSNGLGNPNLSPTGAAVAAGQGLRNMQERAERLNGTLHVSPARAGGTQIEVSIPT